MCCFRSFIQPSDMRKMRRSALSSAMLTILVFSLSRAPESTAVDDWCIDDVTNYNAYQSALDYVNSTAIRQTELQTFIDDALARAGCHWLQMTSTTNMTCSGVSLCLR